MGCLTRCLKYMVVVCNLLLALIGIVLLAGGIVLLAGNQNYIQTFFKDYYDSSGGNCTENSTRTDEPERPTVDFSELLRPFAIVLIVSGAIISVIAFVGVFGICCRSYSLLIIYAVVMIILIVAEIVLSILFFIKLFDSDIKAKVKETVVKHYVDINDQGGYSLAWNYLMIEHSCCGVDGYEDFNSSLKWTRDRDLSPSGDTLNSTVVAPFACCKNIKEIRKNCYQDIQCALYPTDENSNWKQGCWKEIEKIFEPYRVKVIGIVCAIVVAQTVLVFIAIVVAWTLYKTSKPD